MSDKIELTTAQLAEIVNTAARYAGEITYVLTYVPGVGWVLQPQPPRPRTDRVVLDDSLDELVIDDDELERFAANLSTVDLLLTGAQLHRLAGAGSTSAKHENLLGPLTILASHLLHTGVTQLNAKHENSVGAT